MKYAKTLYSALVTGLIISVLVLIPQAAVAEVEPEFSGYDLVSYFEKGKAEQGDAQFTYLYKQAVYQFSSGKHLALFKTNPERYLPQYDGYCAYGITFGKKLEGSPEAWKIVNGKLYFNLDKTFLEKWAEDVDASILIGDEQWQQLK